MTVATLSEVLSKAKEHHYAVAGLVVLGWEDARCYAEVAEELGLPIILQAGPGCRANTPVPILGKMFRHLAEQSSQPIVCHLDHGYSKEECIEGMENGFTSVMFDGSKLSLNENIEKTHEIAELAHKNDISVEGEIGFVGYSEGAASQSTDPLEAKEFADKTNWRKMLKNEVLEDVDLASVKAELVPKIEDRFQEYLTDDAEVVELKYPVDAYPEKVKSVGFDKLPEIEGRLMGIKGQYLLLDENRVLNMRKHTGYHITFCA